MLGILKKNKKVEKITDVMNEEQCEAYNQWKYIKRKIADLEKQKRILEKEKKDMVKIFDEAFITNGVVIGPGGVKVFKCEEPVHVNAFDYVKTQYKEG